MRFSKSISFKVKFFIIISLLIIVLLLGVFSLLLESRISQKKFLSSSNLILDKLSNDMIEPLWNYDIVSTKTIINYDINQKDVYYIIVYNHRDDFYFGMIKEKSINDNLTVYDYGKKIQNKHFSLKLTNDIYKNKTKVGKIEIAFQNNDFKEQLEISVIKIILQIALFSIIIYLIIHFSLNILVFHPFQILNKSVSKFSEKDFSERVKIIRDDEIGNLSNNFNKMAEIIESYSNHLEDMIKERTKELEEKNNLLLKANEEIKSTQDQLIQSEKLAALGHLIAGVSHEINTPLGAIRSSITDMNSFFSQSITSIFEYLIGMNNKHKKIFFQLIQQSQYNINLSSRDERKIKQELKTIFINHNIPDYESILTKLIIMGIHKNIELIIPLFDDENGVKIFECAYKFIILFKNTNIIELATQKASKVVFALKNYARVDSEDKMTETDIVESIEAILILYQNQLKHGIEIIKKYNGANPILCYHDEINQVWTNIIHNAIQAMDNMGTITIEVFEDNEFLVASFEDTGKGIPDSIKEKIFEPFFTTKAAGEGSGLGLHIVRKIIEKHKGKIEVDSEVGKGTKFTFYLPNSNN